MSSREDTTPAVPPRGQGFYPATLVQSCASRLGEESRETLESHHSSLPAFLYLLSFAPTVPSPIRTPREFFRHPYIMYTIGLLAAILGGFASFPVLDLIYGLYWSNRISYSASPDVIRHASNFSAIILISTAAATLICTWVFQTCFSLASSSLTTNLRHAYVASVLSQDASYFDEHGAGEIAAHAGKEINMVRTAFGEKLGFSLWTTTILVASIIQGFCVAARVTGFLFAVVPLVLALFAILAWTSEAVGAPALRLEGRASTFVEEILSSMRIVQSFGMTDALLRKYNFDMLRQMEKFGRRKALIRGTEAGAVYFALFITYSAAFWFVGHEVVRGRVDLGNGLTAFWNMINSLFAFSSAVPHIASIVEAMSALRFLRAAIERDPKIDVREKSGIRLQDRDIIPEFRLEDVTLAYPSRPNIPSLRNVTLTLGSGKVTALVGPSGSGKSTITSLLLREYDPQNANVPLESDLKVQAQAKKEDEKAQAQQERKENDVKSRLGMWKPSSGKRNKSPSPSAVSDVDQLERGEKEVTPVHRVEGGGRIFFSDQDVRDINLRWLRSQIAIVRQNPQIFTATVFENVAAGLSGTMWAYRPDVDGREDAPLEVKERTSFIRDKVRTALAKAQALDFVERLPEGMDTPISGGKTGLLSGGQRQRLSLARALVREPRVLVIDEGTSAIDTNTEDKIRIMLEKEHADRGMTTVLIAHRLSTVEHADSIIVMKNGRVIDQGTHAELMETKRPDQTYRDMVNHQRAVGSVEDPSEAHKDTSESDSASISSKREIVSDAVPKLEGISDATTTLAPASTIVPLSHTTQQPSERPAALTHRSSLASDQSGWSVSGRFKSFGQIEHAAEASTNSVELFKTSPGAAMDKSDNAKGGEVSGGNGSRSSVESFFAPENEVSRPQLWRRFARTVSQHWFEFTIGIIGAVVVGVSFPIVGWITGLAVDALNSPTKEGIASGTERWALVFLCIAFAVLAIVLLQSYYLETASESMGKNLKYRALGALMRQEIGFFDKADAQSGALAANVAGYPASIAAATGLVLSQIIISLANLVGSVVLAFILSWKVSLVVLSPVVILFFSGWINIAMLERYESSLHEPASQASSFISENVDAIKEVSALGRERETLRIFDERVRSNTPKQTRYLVLGGGGFAVSQAAVFASAALIFYYGGKLHAEGQLSTTALYAIFEAGIISIFAAGRIFTFTGDIGRAAAAFHSLCKWFERRPRIASLPKSSSDQGSQDWVHDDITFEDVELRYPRRPNHPAIRDLNLTIRAGQHQAFCGTSGSGKSTILQMVQRFYDPYRGRIMVGRSDIRTKDLDEIRSAMSYVSQDACLYDGTIRFNLMVRKKALTCHS